MFENNDDFIHMGHSQHSSMRTRHHNVKQDHPISVVLYVIHNKLIPWHQDISSNVLILYLSMHRIIMNHTKVK